MKLETLSTKVSFDFIIAYSNHKTDINIDDFKAELKELTKQLQDTYCFNITHSDIQVEKEECPDCEEYIPHAKDRACKLEKCKYE